MHPSTIAFLEKFTKTIFKTGIMGYIIIAAPLFSILYYRLGFSFFNYILTTISVLWIIRVFGKVHGFLPKKSVQGDHVFITGAGSGLGKDVATNLAKLGAKISLVDLNLPSVQKVEEELKSQGLKAKAIQCDVSDLAAVKRAAAEARSAFGDVDILINNAGIVSGKKILESSEELMAKTIAVNTTALCYTVKQFLPKMIEKNKGHVVTVASMAGIVGTAGLVDYSASKFGAVGFDESLRRDLKKNRSNVKTTCICPFYIDTGMFKGVAAKYSFLTPIMTQEKASTRITNAILQDEEVAMLPWDLGVVTVFFKAILPDFLFDIALDAMGINNCMDHFKGRN